MPKTEITPESIEKWLEFLDIPVITAGLLKAYCIERAQELNKLDELPNISDENLFKLAKHFYPLLDNDDCLKAFDRIFERIPATLIDFLRGDRSIPYPEKFSGRDRFIVL